MPDDLAALYESRRSLLEHVAHSLDGEVRECLTHCPASVTVSFRVLSVSTFLEKVQRKAESGGCSEPLVEIEDQISGRAEVSNAEALDEVEAILRDCFSIVESSNHRRRLVCVIPPQAKPPGWVARDDVPHTFQLELRVPRMSHHEDLKDEEPDGETAAGKSAIRRDQAPTSASSQFDVFLAHNSRDKPGVEALANELKKRGMRPWLDSDQIAPGRSFQDAIQEAIGRVHSIAICIGVEGLGKWQALELKVAISKCINKGIPVIPVLLPGVDSVPPTFPFLAEFCTFRDLVCALRRVLWA